MNDAGHRHSNHHRRSLWLESQRKAINAFVCCRFLHGRADAGFHVARARRRLDVTDQSQVRPERRRRKSGRQGSDAMHLSWDMEFDTVGTRSGSIILHYNYAKWQHNLALHNLALPPCQQQNAGDGNTAARSTAEPRAGKIQRLYALPCITANTDFFVCATKTISVVVARR